MNGVGMEQFDWSLVRCFLAVADKGSFSAAAKVLNISQPTIGRKIQQLENQLGVQLFQRETHGQSLTEQAGSLIANARLMKEAAARISMAADGQTESLSGVVRITASVIVSHYMLPSILAGIRRAEPEIELELSPSDSTENLLFREADIAVRMYRPTQLDVIARKVGKQSFGMFATKDYLNDRGRPETIEELLAHELIGFDRSEDLIAGMNAQGFPANRSSFGIRCDNQTVYRELIGAGCGIGVSALGIVDFDPNVERVLTWLEIPELPIWLTAHAALKSSPRIRRVYDLLADGLRQSTG